MTPYEVTPVCPDVWAIWEQNVRMYLIDAGTRAILIDTGYGLGILRRQVEELTDKPVDVILTHSHADHIGSCSQFRNLYFSLEDAPEIRPHCPPDANIQLVEDGEQILSGDTALDVIATPGHTPGAIALLDKKRRLIFTGDSFARAYPIYMQYPGQDMARYLQSMLRIAHLEAYFDRICPAHGALEIEKRDMYNTIECCRSILNGTAEYGTAPLFDGTMHRAAWYEGAAIFC